MEEPNQVTPAKSSPSSSSSRVAAAIALGAALLVGLGALLTARAAARTNDVALASRPKPVSFVVAKRAPFRASRRYVATVEPWLRANVGPQLVSAYVDTVLVRPGAVVKRGEVLATLDCRNASAADQAVAMSARALEARRAAIEKETARVTGLLDGGFVAPNEVDQRTAESASMAAQLLAAKAQLTSRSLEVSDCVLRAPFDGEIADRFLDPGAFARPGQAIVAIVDRSTVRIAGDAPEIDFGVVAPGTEATSKLLATGASFVAKIARRAPAADLATRTVHFEIDVPDGGRALPVGTTAELRVDVGAPVDATSIPLTAASVRGAKAALFVVDGDVARARTAKVLGERDGVLFLERDLAEASHVVSEGRALLADGDRVEAREETPVAPAPPAPAKAREGGEK